MLSLTEYQWAWHCLCLGHYLKTTKKSTRKKYVQVPTTKEEKIQMQF